MAEIVTLTRFTPSIQHLCKKDRRMAKVISMVGDISYESHIDAPYQFLIHEIIEQMLSIKAGAKIYERLKDLCDGVVTPDAVCNLSDEQLKSIGTSNAKVGYIRSLTNAVKTKSLVFTDIEVMPDKQVIKNLTTIHGIGIWSAKMYLIFVLDRQDILPTEDVAFLQGYEWVYKTKDRSTEAVKKKCQKWRPYSSIAARYLYRALDMGLTKEEFHLFKKEK